ncbi:hypothetical protein ACFFLM_15225 [Deinococcus oregonensis]|uniref:Uncharacterized protein n=1 Tax=Deinococcus oregonensis TaxID=1805970 RepID=A0ABV6B0Q1_9DEIO
MNPSAFDQNLQHFNAKYRPHLQALASVLATRGVARLHYGVDYVNDDGDQADYAVYEYADGRSIEQGNWPPELEYDVFLYGVQYCQPYTFEVATATLHLDTQGGQVNTEENVLRNYHTPQRRQLLEQQADVYDEHGDELGIFNAVHADELQELADELKAQGLELLYFGIDALTENGEAQYPLSDWCAVQRGGREELVSCLPALQAREDLWEDLPSFGAFSLDLTTAQVSEDEQGGSVELELNVSRAFHTAFQRQAILESGLREADSL